MPTYVFSTAKELTATQRKEIVESVTLIHHEEATAPRYFVQVIFYKVDAGSIFIGGEVASSDHIWVRADIRSGRTREQKAGILQRIMKETGRILQTSEENVWVFISDIPAEGIAEYGVILPQPGGEEKWFAALPSSLREKLQAV